MKSSEFIKEAKPHVFWGQLDIVNQNFITDKAKMQADGIYKCRGIMYRVRNHGVTHCATPDGKIVMCIGHFNTGAGQVEGGMGGMTELRNYYGELNDL